MRASAPPEGSQVESVGIIMPPPGKNRTWVADPRRPGRRTAMRWLQVQRSHTGAATPMQGSNSRAAGKPLHCAVKENAHRAIRDPGLQKALARSGPSFIARRAAAVANLPEFEALRDTARDI